MRNIKILKKLNDWSYLIFVLGYDILQSMLNMYDIPCDVSFEYCTNLHSTYISSPESEQDKSDYECLQDYVNNHMHEIESEVIELAEKYGNNKKKDYSMIKFTTINIDNEFKNWEYNSVEDLKKMYYAEDYDGPGGEDPVTRMSICDIPVYVKDFDSIVDLFNI